MDELKMMCDSAESRLAMGAKELQRRPRSRGEEAAPEKLHEGDLYLCSESLDAIEGALGAVCDGMDTIFGPGPRRAFVGVRPPGHHCSASHPSGFCWVNNVHIGFMYGVLQHGVTHAAIIDFDLHHGDGSQSIAWQHNSRSQSATKNAAPWKKTSIGYFSLHDINSYPCEGGDDEKVKNASLCIDNAHGQTVWNVHLHSWKTEQEFWELYDFKYSVLLDKTRNYLKNQAQRLKDLGQVPKAVIFFSAGFDASEWESAGMQRHQVNVPTEFYARLSHDVVKLASEEGLGVDGRVISVLEGGYSDRALFSGTCSHLSGLVGAQDPVSSSSGLNGLGSEMGRKIGAVSEEPTSDQDFDLSSAASYDPSWWASAELDKLEALITKPAEAPKKPRQSTPSTYSSPTQASTAKVTDPIKMRRSLSGLSTANKVPARPPSPPPPEVHWTIAAHELSKLLIPADRQTDSCKPEDLNAEATRARQARQSSLMGTTTPMATPMATPERTTSKMALRGRKPKPTLPIDEEDLTTNRRRTVATTTASPAKVASCSTIYDAYADILSRQHLAVLER
jgi:histone deacetylase HOS3